MSTEDEYGGLSFGEKPATAALAAAIEGGAATVLGEWLAGAGEPAALSDEQSAHVAELGAALSSASEAVLVDSFDPANGARSAYTLLHDGELAVVAGGGPEKAVASAPHGLDDAIADLCLQIGGRVDDGPPRTARIAPLALAALCAALDPRPDRSRPEALRRLGALAGEVSLDLSAEEMLDALETDLLLQSEADQVGPGPHLLSEPALAAAVDGSLLTITRMSLSRSGEPLAYDVRALEFIGPAESRCLVLPVDENGEVGFARLTVAELTALLASHLVGRAEPALVAAPPVDPEPELPEPGTSADLQGSDLLEASADPSAPSLARALLAPPATLTLRRADGDRDLVEGIAIWAAGVAAWSWSRDAGYALAKPREELPRLAEAMLTARLASGEREELLLGASRWSEEGLERLDARIAVGDDSFTVLDDDGLDIGAETGAGSLVDALLRAAGLDR